MSERSAAEQIIERIVTARRLSSRYLAEADGLLGALFHLEAPNKLFSEEDLRQACLRGFEEGCAILHAAATEPAEPVEHPAAHGY